MALILFINFSGQKRMPVTPSLLILHYIDSCAKERRFAYAMPSRPAAESPIPIHPLAFFWVFQEGLDCLGLSMMASKFP